MSRLFGSGSSAGKSLEVRTTAYTHTERDHRAYGRKTAAGTTLQAGRVTTAASDWSFLPFGTEFRIKGDSTLYKIEDYGSALVGTQTIDIYRPSHRAMNSWGVRHVEIEIVKAGCVATSMEILSDRTRYRHCRSMLNGLKSGRSLLKSATGSSSSSGDSRRVVRPGRFGGLRAG